MRSLLRWAGSKKQLLQPLGEYWTHSPGGRYVEPFAGSAALFFSIAPKRALICDLNSTLIDFYRTIKRFPEQVYGLASSFPVTPTSYYSIRKSFTGEPNAARRSAMFYYLNRYCFNGIYRTNADGQFNVPFSGSKTGGFPSWREFSESVTLLRHASTRCRDFESVISEEVTEGDFVYLDPPYAVGNRRVFRQYNAQSFGLHDLQRLSETLIEIDRRGAKFVLSYALCKEALDHFESWRCRRVQCHRNVSGFAKHRRKAVELIVSNISIPTTRAKDLL